MIINTIKDDIFLHFSKKKYDVFVHGANCFCTMGSGVALIVKHKYPRAYQEDLRTQRGSKDKLGLYSFAITDHGLLVNLYSQYRYGNDEMHCDYEAIKNGFTLLNENFKGQNFCIVKIGAGLAGGDWTIIEKIINDVTPDIKIDVYYI